LYEAHAAELRKHARRFVHSSEAAEDVVQDVFLRVCRLWRRIDVGVNIRAYLFTAARSRALDHLERERREERRRQRYEAPMIIDEGQLVPGEGEPSATGREIVDAIKRVLETMPPRRREVAALRLFEKLTAAEIGQRLGISPRTAEAHLAAATKTMQELLPKLLGERRPGSGQE